MEPRTDVDVSVVLPCLNEAETLQTCIEKAQSSLEDCGVSGEVIVADNGSTDGSIEIARAAGARVVSVAAKGYGNALIGGFEAARGRYLVMGDADDSYDFAHLGPFIEKLGEGYDVVMGNRFLGGIAPGAMPWHHRYVGNPVLTGILNLFFRSGVGDTHCGLRALTADAFLRLDLCTGGMEFASEMVVKAALGGLRMTEVPTRLSPDGRSRPPHLRSFRDGWRHLRFLMLMAPNWTLILPGCMMMMVGALLVARLFAGPILVGGAELDVHTMLCAALLIVAGYQTVTVGFAARIFALEEHIGPPSPALRRAFGILNLERAILLGGVLLLSGLAAIGWVGVAWAGRSFGPLPVQQTMRPVIVGVTLAVLGLQTILMSFFYSMLGLQRREVSSSSSVTPSGLGPPTCQDMES